MEKPWVEQHKPKQAKELVGQDEAIAKIRNYVKTYRPGQKPLLIYGPTGTGKTSAVYVVAQELDKELIEINASDSRNKDSINTLVGSAAKQQSLFFKGKVILVDEVDGVSGNSDRGGVAALVALIPESRFPILFIANDAYADKLSSLRKACELVECKPVDLAMMVQRLKTIAQAESITVADESLGAIARRVGGDLRAAINDMQSLVSGKTITKEEIVLLSDREIEETVQHALRIIFKTTSAQVALPAFERVDENVDQLILWIDENLPREYSKPEDLARAFDALAEADKFFGRIRKWQYYRYYVYIYNLLSAGIAIAKEQKYPGAQEYKQTQRILKMWIYNQKNAKRKALSQVLSSEFHTSARRARQDILPYLRAAAMKDKKFYNSLIECYELDPAVAEWLVKT